MKKKSDNSGFSPPFEIDRRAFNRPFEVPIQTNDDLFDSDYDPYNDVFQHQPTGHRWLISACIAGLAATVAVGGALFGFFEENQNANVAFASVQPTEFWQRPSVSNKTNFVRELASLPGRGEARKSSVVFTEEDIAPGEVTGSLREDVTIEAVALSPDDIGAAPLKVLAVPESPVVLDGGFGSDYVLTPNQTTISKTPPPEPVDRHVVLEKGRTLAEKLKDIGIGHDTAMSLAVAVEPIYPSRLMKPGQKFIVTLDRQQDYYGNEVIYPVELRFSPGPNENIIVQSDEDGRFIAAIEGEKTGAKSRYAKVIENSDFNRARGQISSTLYASARDQGVPEYIINRMIHSFSFEVDFQREIKAGDGFDMFFGKPLSGSSANRKVLHSASLILGGKRKTLYRFTTKDGKTGYYDEKGRSATRSLVATPVSGARISSGFGLRKHPILGYSKLHTGIDFAAPRGTPIRAAGSGTIEYAKNRGAYGRTVIIKHDNGYKTLYAHMHRIGKGIKPGHRVKQGQVIGTVGSTGRSTGPHLHYEVRRGDKPVNPRKVRVVGSRPSLKGKELERFQKHTQKIIALAAETPTTTQLAQADTQ